MAQDVDEEVAVGAHAVNAGAGQRVGQHARGLPPRRRVGDDLGQHRVVEHRHLRPVDDAGVDAHSEAVERPELRRGVRYFETLHRAGLRLPALGRVFCVQPGLDGVAARRRWLGVEVAAVGDVQLQPDEVEAGGGLGDRVLDLQSGVHLEKEEVAVVVGHEFDRARAGVPDRGRSQSRGVEQLVPHARNAFDQWRRRLFDDLLMPPLNRAFAFADGPHGAVLVGEHLNLHVVAGGQIALAEDGGVTERGLRFAACRLDLRWQLGQFAHHAHAAAAAARRRLDQHRQLVRRHCVGVEFVEHRHARGGHHLLGLDLGAHRRHRGNGRPDPRQPRVQHGSGEIGVLGEESVAGVDGVGAGRPSRRDQLRAVQVPVAALQAYPRIGLCDVRRAGVRVGVHGDRADAETSAGGEYPAGDLAPVGDQYSCDHGAHILKTPKFDVPLIGPLAMADRHIPNTVRVSRGSITPSS